MDYITKRRGDTLSNEPFEITYSDIKEMHENNLKEQLECKRIEESSQRGETYYNDGKPGKEEIKDSMAAFLKEVLYRDVKTSGFIMKYPHGTVIRQGERESYYRGENQIYPKSQPSLFRSLEKLDFDEERHLYQIVADMRIAEFRHFLYRLDIVKFWVQNYSDVLFEPLAQHYGFETKWLDITNDFDIALFFATCGWNEQKKCWYPLTKEQTEKNYNSQYGVIFHIPRWQADTQRLSASCLAENSEDRLHKEILPIGYQPFVRCQSQYAYGINMLKPFLLQDDKSYEKLHFRHDEKLSKEVFEMMDCGKKIYPHEGLDEFHDILKSIQNATSFSQEAFKYAFAKSSHFTDEVDCKEKLKSNKIFNKPIKITDDEHPFKVSRQRIRRLNRKYENFSL
ncbi:MAG: FRG domain-containing protein [Ruminococcus sp.]|nr:FRG domain-containing protein [Ruminococcus sp.]